ncbi:hypothetical protein PRZ48_006051 [Zasmidium cellare]|uniref:BTB domain-containing protein n=1 Tax=Zasmidium cellare TaxID=395010 RepID=A0ABR0EMC5_ZASCE|nr:hypothetical protein PRZ48_006051 [Zasmidium cellare]
MATYQGDALKTGVKELLKTGLFSDYEIIDEMGNKTFHVHKIILYTHSKFFQKLLTGGFREAKSAESSVILTEDASILQAVINYMYGFPWDDSIRDDLLSSTVFAVLVYQAADKYEIPPLTTLAASRFKMACDPLTDVPAFVDGIRHIDSCCNPKDRTLWDIALPLIKKNMTHLLKFEEFRTLIKENDELNFELLGQMYQEASVEKETGVEDESGGRRLGGGRRLPSNF